MSNKPNWFAITEGLSRGMTFCNERLSDECFSNMLEYLFRTFDNYPTTGASQTESDTESEMENLRTAAQLNEQEFKLALQSMAYLVKRSLKFMLKPSSLQADLRNHLQVSENKCNSFVKYWIQSTKIVLDALEAEDDGEHGKSNQLTDASWKVRAQLSSEPRQKDKLALGQLELKTGGRTVNLELNSGEIVEFYNQLERIQVELDSLNVKA